MTAPTPNEPSPDMQRAKAVQLGMLPEPPVIPGLDIHVHYEACESIGGDFYDFINVSPNELGIVVADVSGHGVDAALLMAAAKKSIQIHARGRSSPRETLTTVCRDLVSDLPRSSFITVFYGILDMREGVLRFASAGHNPPVHLSAEGVRQVPSRGMVISATLAHMLEKSIEEQAINLADGDTVVLYTDGVTESKAADSTEFGEVAFAETLEAQAGESAVTVSDAIVKATEVFRADEQEDDVTLLVFRCQDLDLLRSRRTPTPQESRWPTNLGVATQRLIGRDDLIADMASTLATQQVLSVIGPGGVGKTALITELGRQVLQGYAGGAWRFDCIELAEFDDLIAITAQTLGIGLRRDVPVAESLIDGLRHRPPTLLLLDGTDGVSGLSAGIREMVSSCPDLRVVLAAYSEPDISGARKFVITGLDWPGKRSQKSRAELEKLASIEFFLERCRENDPALNLSDEEFKEVVGICHEIEGLPLAIELAAASIDVLPLSRIHQALREHSHKVDALEGAGVNTAVLRKTLEWTYGLLTNDERLGVQLLSVFRGGFGVEAGEAVLKGFVAQPIDVITSLRRKGIVDRQATPYGARFHLGAPLRGLGRAEWEAKASAQEDGKLLSAYVEFYAKFAAEMQKLFRLSERVREGTELFERTALEFENLRHAFEHAFRAGSGEIVAPLGISMANFYGRYGPRSERKLLLERALSVVDDDLARSRADLLGMLAIEEFDGGNLGESIRRAEESLALEKAHDFDEPLLGAHLHKAVARSYLGEMDEALRDFREEERRCTAAGESAWGMLAHCYLYCAHVLEYNRRFDEAMLQLDKAEEFYAKSMMPGGRVRTLSCRAAIATKQRRHDAAIKSLREAVEIAKETEQHTLLANELNSLGIALLRGGRYDEALSELEKGETAHREVGHHLGLVANRSNLAELCLFMGKLDRSIEYTVSTEEEAARLKFVPVAAKAAMLRACISLVQDKHADAHTKFEQAADKYRECGDHTRAAIAQLGAAFAMWLDGQRSESHDFVRKVRGKLKNEQNPAGDAMFLLGVLRALTARGVVRKDQQEVLDQRAERLAGRYGGNDREHTFGTFLAMKTLVALREA